jgi:hypothetical protein
MRGVWCQSQSEHCLWVRLSDCTFIRRGVSLRSCLVPAVHTDVASSLETSTVVLLVLYVRRLL